MTIIDDTKLNEFVGRVLGDVGGAMSVPLVRMGEALGLYKKLGEIGPSLGGGPDRRHGMLVTLYSRVAVGTGSLGLCHCRDGTLLS